jgi:hypothetical protein
MRQSDPSAIRVFVQSAAGIVRKWFIGRHDASMLNARMTQASRILLWLILAALAAWVTYLGFRGYLSAELLFNFSNSFSC